MLKNKTNDKIVNGVNVTAFFDTVEAIKDTPSLAKFTFKLDNRWISGGLNRSAINGFYGAGEDQTRDQAFYYDNDEPPILLGQDSNANPAEFLLHALAGCLTTTMVYHAAARGIVIEKIESELNGDTDARPFLDITQDVQPGFHFIDAVITVKSEADPETLRELAQFSPIFQTINGKTPVNITVTTY